ncbi:SHOCT domain-containing protein [Nocardioides alpinus]|uniref:SHOCT domain-containing protein n=1 Tax=Nocardioides alpinus TaxID=748909 RepID=UPI0012FEF370|nr:SHOCT domain-containing protein [Nocardioides alpinus]
MQDPPAFILAPGAPMDDFSLLDLFFTLGWIYILVAWFWFLITLMADVLRSKDLSGLSKALWIIGLIFFPFLAALVYLVARGASMNERRREDMAAMQQPRHAAAAPSTADEIAKLASLRDSGALTAAEFDTQKARLLAS